MSTTVTDRKRHRWPWLWAGAVSAIAVLLPLTWQPAEVEPGDAISAAIFTAAMVLINALGAVLRTKVPENPIGWLFFITGSGLVLSSISGTITPDAAPSALGLPLYAALVFSNALSTFTIFYPFILLLYLFPTGRFINGGWSWAGWFGLLGAPLLLTFHALADQLGPAFVDNRWLIENPIGLIDHGLVDAVTTFVFIGFVVVALGGVTSAVVRYRRASLLERTQLKWLTYPGVVFAICYIVIAVGPDTDSPLWGALFVAPFTLVPVAVTIAITRYRLFEIDRIISRTVSYAVVVGMLALVFVIGAVWLPASTLGERPPLFVAASTLAVAALFNPLRTRIQRLVDRRFNRSAYEAERFAENFSTKIRNAVSEHELAEQWAAAAQRALEPESVGFWLNPRP